jgi:hypothetical protein
MSEREPVLEWLDRAAARARFASRLREAACVACALLALLALHQGLRLVISAPEVLAALLPFFFLAAAGAGAVFAVRMWRAPTLTQAAAAADSRAGLKDELRSALWFAQHGGGGPVAGLLLARAARTVQALDARRLFPLALPPLVASALGLALAAVALTGLLPGLGSLQGTPAAAPPPAAGPVAVRASQRNETARTAEYESPGASVSERARAVWAELEDLASALADDAESQAIGQAIAAHDAAYAARLLEVLQRRRGVDRSTVPAARPDTEQMSDALAQGILERLQEILKEQAQAEQAAPGRAEALVPHLTEQLREDAEVQKGEPSGQQSAGETALNAVLRAINRSSIGQRDVLGGAGAAGEEAGRTNIGGGAMGRRVGTSRAGAGEDERSQADPAGDAEAEPVLGRKTQRLQAQLQRIKVEPSPGEDRSGAEESLYAATRAQSARAGYQSVAARAHQEAEGRASGERMPLAYRDAAKRYTLEQHRDLKDSGLGTQD